jgi:hypothetical protein
MPWAGMVRTFGARTSTEKPDGEARRRTPTANPDGEPKRRSPTEKPDGEARRRTPTEKPDGEARRRTPTANPNGEPQRRTPTANPNGESKRSSPTEKGIGIGFSSGGDLDVAVLRGLLVGQIEFGFGEFKHANLATVRLAKGLAEELHQPLAW